MPNVFESTENVDAMLRSKRVLVVGNGPSARSVKIPEIMGDYDLVVRFNCWKKDSHTSGERCDVWVTNLSPHDTEKHLPKAAAEGYKASLFLICAGLGAPSSVRVCHFRDIIKTGFGDVPVGEVPPSFAKTLSKRVGIKVTTGLTAIHYLLSLGCEVTICGFDILAGRQCTPRHYWGGRSNIRKSHSPAKEGSILWELISSGAIRTVGDVPALWVDTSPVRSLDYFDSMQETIPRIIHLVWLGTMVPEWVRAFMQAVIDLHPQWEVKLHTDLPSSAGSELAEAYNSAEQWCQRADIVRYVALRDFGGIYIDADCVILRALDPLLKAGPFWIARQADGRFNNAFIGCEKGCKEINQIIQEVITVHRGGSSRRARFGPDMLTNMVDVSKSITVNQLPKHYFMILDKQSSAHKFLHSDTQARAGHLNNLQGRITDGVTPFLVHLWGYEGSSKAPVSEAESAAVLKQSEAYSRVDGYATHLPALTFAVECMMSNFSSPRVVELGCGFYSSVFLNALSKSYGFRYDIVFQDEAWADAIKPLVPNANWIRVAKWDAVKSVLGDSPDIGLCLVDQEQVVVNRLRTALTIRDICKIMVFHDSDRIGAGGNSSKGPLSMANFKFRRDFLIRKPFTSVVSDFIDVASFTP